VSRNHGRIAATAGELLWISWGEYRNVEVDFRDSIRFDIGGCHSRGKPVETAISSANSERRRSGLDDVQLGIVGGRLGDGQ
jgi:hypothetical protein